MSGLALRILIWACIIWLPGVMYLMLRNETKFKKNLAVGVTIPYEGRSDQSVLALLARFKRQIGWVSLTMAALGTALMLLPVGLGTSLMLWGLWADLCIVAEYLPYVSCNRALKRLKAERGWRRAREGTVAVDLGAAAQPERRLSPLHFLPPLALALLPAAAECLGGSRVAGAVLALNGLCVVVFYAIYRWARRQAELTGEDTDLNAALTRLRRRAWLRFWLWGAWFMGLFSPAMWLCMYRVVPGLIAIAVLSAGLLLVLLRLELGLRRRQERLTRDSGKGFYPDADDQWIGGVLYCNPQDRHLLVNDRVGMGMTVNLARRGGQVVMGVVAVLLLCLPLMGVPVMLDEHGTVSLSVEEGAVTAAHGGSRYEIAMGEIARAELLGELPAGLRRVAGTAMDSVYKGRWRCDRYGELTLCLDPREGPYLLLELENGRRYLLGAPGETRAVWEQVTSAAAPAGQ